MDGTTVARSALASVIDGSCVLDVQKNLVSAAPFAAFFEDREHGPAEEATLIDIKPQALTESDKPREIFISYAWGDETPEGKIRTQAVDGLCTALKSDGILILRDRDTIRFGDLISAFIRRLTRADLVVAVISDKYLRSPFCMTEIHGLWQKSQEEPALMAERLVPIILPEVRIGALRDRAVYLRYWKEQKEELEALFREFGPDLDPGTLRDLRLVRHFAQDVDGILRFLQDVLMPRNLQDYLDNGFEAVREALRRRMS